MFEKFEILIIIIIILLAFYFVITLGAGKGKDPHSATKITRYLFDLWVDAPQYLSAGTLTFPNESNSVLNFIFMTIPIKLAKLRQ